MPNHEISQAGEQWWWAISMFIIGFAFYACEMLLGNVMSPRTYGFAAYDIDARVWAQGYMSASALCLYGLWINGRWPLWSPVLRVSGWLFLSWMSAVLAWSGWTAEDGLHIALFSVLLFLRRFLGFAILNCTDALGRWRGRDVDK